MREKSALDNIYRLFDDGGDGVHSFHEFESMFRHVDPNITTRLALQYFNKTLDANRRKAALEQERIEEAEQEKKRIEKAKMKTISVGKKEKETVEEEESDDDDRLQISTEQINLHDFDELGDIAGSETKNTDEIILNDVEELY